MSSASVHPLALEANDARSGRVAGGVSLLLHGAVLTVLAFGTPLYEPPEPSDVSLASALSFEVDALEDPLESPVEDPPDETEEEGGNDGPNTLSPDPRAPPRPHAKDVQAAPQPKQIEPEEPEDPDEPYPDEPEPDEPEDPDEPDGEEPDELIADDASSAQEAPEPVSGDEKQSADANRSTPSTHSQGGPSGGSGKGLGTGHGDGVGLAKPVNLFHTFLESLPKAARFDPSWAALPRGEAGTIRFRVTIEEGKLQKLQIVQQAGETAPPHLRRIVTANHQLLMSRRFTLYPDHSSGTRTFILKASIARRSADEQAPEALGIRQMGRLGLPQNNGAYFSYYSGQHVDLLMMQER